MDPARAARRACGAGRRAVKAETRAIARAFLDPARPFDRYLYYYASGKLGSDPVYRGTLDALAGTDAPLLDVGCGIGLLVHALRGAGRRIGYHGIDLDAEKIERARQAATRAGLGEARFEAVDAGAGLPAHHGSVAILDVLQYLPAAAQEAVLAGCIARLAPGARLVIRTGLRDGGARSRFTRIADFFGHHAGWMKATPKHFPTRDWFESQLAAAGLRAGFTPLHGNTPFNNWLIVAEHDTAG